MFNISRMTSFLHSFQFCTSAESRTDNIEVPLIFVDNGDNQQTPAKEEKSIFGGQWLRRKSSKKNDKDDNDNESGGMLEPLIEDLQGLFRGKR